MDGQSKDGECDKIVMSAEGQKLIGALAEFVTSIIAPNAPGTAEEVINESMTSNVENSLISLNG